MAIHAGAANIWRGIRLAAIVSLLAAVPDTLAQQMQTQTPDQDLSGARQARPLNVTLSPLDPALGWTFDDASFGSVTDGKWSKAEANSATPAQPAVALYSSFEYTPLKDLSTDKIFFEGHAEESWAIAEDGIDIRKGKFVSPALRYSTITQSQNDNGATPIGYITAFQIPQAPILEADSLDLARTTSQPMAPLGQGVDPSFTKKRIESSTGTSASWKVHTGIGSNTTSQNYTYVEIAPGNYLRFTPPNGAAFMKISGTVSPKGSKLHVKLSSDELPDVVLDATTARPWESQAVLFFASLDPLRSYTVAVYNNDSESDPNNQGKYVGFHGVDYWFVDAAPVDPNASIIPTSSGKAVSTGVIVGAVVGGTVGLAFLVVLIYLCIRHRQKKRAAKAAEGRETRMSNWSVSAGALTSRTNSRYTDPRGSMPYSASDSSRRSGSRHYMSGTSGYVTNPDFRPYQSGDHFGSDNRSMLSLPITDPTSDSARDSGLSNDPLIPRSMDEKPPQSIASMSGAPGGPEAVPVVRNVAKRRVVQQEADAGKLEEFVLPNHSRGYTITSSEPGTPDPEGGPSEYFGSPSGRSGHTAEPGEFPAVDGIDFSSHRDWEEPVRPPRDSIPRDWVAQVDFDRPLSP